MIVEEMTMSEFEDGLTQTRTILVPFGSTEEHGSHLPLSTDTIQAYEIGKKAARIVPLFVAPPIHYGNCRSTAGHPGTISVSAATIKSLAKDIVRSCRFHGLTNFILLSGHAGGAHGMALQSAGEELLLELPDIQVAVVIEFELARKCGGGIIETEGDCHAGEIETSRIMHSHPHLVKGEGIPEFPSFPDFLLVRKKRACWSGGVWGDPTKASTAKGKLLEDRVVASIVKLVRQMKNFQG